MNLLLFHLALLALFLPAAHAISVHSSNGSDYGTDTGHLGLHPIGASKHMQAETLCVHVDLSKNGGPGDSDTTCLLQASLRILPHNVSNNFAIAETRSHLNDKHKKFEKGSRTGYYVKDGYIPAQGILFDAFFGGVSITAKLWDALPGVSFNPSLVVLPERQAQALHSRARFLASFRHYTRPPPNGCKALGKGETAARTEPLPNSSVVVLDEDLKPLMTAALSGEDLRLFVKGDEILVSYVFFSDNCSISFQKACLHLAGLELNSGGGTGGKLTAKYSNLERPLPRRGKASMARQGEAPLLFDGAYPGARNLGLIAHELNTY